MKRLLLVGDSDIAFWPKNLLPSPSNDGGKGGIGAATEWEQPLVSGHPGATLAGVLPHLRRVLVESQTDSSSEENGGGRFADGKNARTKRPSDDTRIVVACAGENDIGDGLSLGKSVEALREFIDAIFTKSDCGNRALLIFLGPKFEPWLDHDPSYKKKYAAMARAFRRGLEEYDTTTSFCNGNSAKRNDKHSDTGDRGGSNFDTHDRILFIDCLTMFCGETANLPGARLGGRARADPRFFASDQLHLSREGYEIWKEAVETGIERLLAPSKQDDP